MAMRSRLAASPALPTAATMRPQFGSSPAIAVFTKGELAIDWAMRRAASSLSAPVTRTVTNLVRPSPSFTTCSASSRMTWASANRKAVARGSSATAMRGAPQLAAGRRVAVDGDCIEALLEPWIETAAQRNRLDRCVSEDKSERGRHVGRDHAGAFGDAIDGDLDPVDLALARGKLRIGVGGHDGARGLLEGIWLCLSREIAEETGDFRRIERLADHAR